MLVLPQSAQGRPRDPLPISVAARRAGLVWAVEANIGQVDLVSGRPGNPLGSGVTRVVGAYGPEWQFAGAVADGACSFGALADLAGATEATWDILVRFSSANPTTHFFGQWDSNQGWLLQANSGALVWVAADDNSGNRRRWGTSGAIFTAAGYYRVIASWQGGAAKCFWLNGQNLTASLVEVSTAATSIGTTMDNLQLGTVNGGSDLSGGIVFARMFRRGLTDAQCAERARASYWVDFDDEILLFVPSSAAALAGDATAQASASADLSTAIPIVGAALAVSTGAATLSTGIPLAGAAAATSVASGQLVTSITLSGQALAQAVASAALSSGIILTADAVATAAAQGTLATAIQMIGAATAQASASGSLDAGASLAGNAQAQATAAASLTVQIQLSAQAIAQAAAAAGLTTAIPLGGAATGQASASATLTAPGGPAQLAGAAAATAAAGAVLTTGIHLTAEAVAAAIAAGSLTAEIRLSGQATADAYGNAALWTQIHITGQAVALATATASLDTTASHWADGPVWMLSSVAPLTLYQVAAQPVATWSPAVEVLAQYSAGVHLVQ